MTLVKLEYSRVRKEKLMRKENLVRKEEDLGSLKHLDLLGK
jgi:hypothetical protein